MQTQYIFYFFRTNGTLQRITEEEYEMILGYMAVEDMPTDESEEWRDYNGETG